MKRKKLANALAGKVLAGEITLEDAWRVLGMGITQKSAVPSLAKAESAGAELIGAAEAMREAAAAVKAARPVTEQDVMDAIRRPMPRPAVTKAAVPAPRETPAEAMKSYRAAQETPAWNSPGRPAGSPAVLALLADSDPAAREGTRSALMARAEGHVI